MRPSARMIVRSAICATSSLWVMTTRVCPYFAADAFKRAIVSSPVRVSRLPVGSSASMMEGFAAMALAMAHLCC